MGPRLFSRGNCFPCLKTSGAGCRFNGAATLQSRKWPPREDRPPRSPEASMGPRLFSRGNGAAGVREMLLQSASMGPRLFSRGNHDCTNPRNGIANMLQWGRDSSVAEMLPARTMPVSWSMGFNGAATLQSRKWEALRKLPHCVEWASMGPRLFSRGNWMAMRFWRDEKLLQWGRDSSVAEMSFPVFGSHHVLHASMGPRLFSRGNDEATYVLGYKGAKASMGPRLFSRGNDEVLAPLVGRAAASMGPRLFSRGNGQRRGAQRRGRHRLQWGRDSSVAEIGVQYEIQEVVSRLQWGRDSSVAEIRNDERVCRRILPL